MHSTTRRSRRRRTPAPRRSRRAGRVLHLHRGGTSVVVDLDAAPAPGDRALGRGAHRLDDRRRCASSPSPLARSASRAGSTSTPRLDARRDAGRRLARHARPRGPPRRRRRSACGSRSPACRPTTTARRIVARRPRGAPHRSARAARRTERAASTSASRCATPATTPYTVQSLQLTFPVPWDATELLDTTGRHLRERTPQRRAFTFGTHLRESRRGRPGADATLLLAAGRPGFGFERGRVHGIHVAWSGNHRVARRARRRRARRSSPAASCSLPARSSSRRASRCTTPWVDRLVGRRAHRAVRTASTTSGAHGRSIRAGRARSRSTRGRRCTSTTPSSKLTALADAAADVGVERFVLDDGWFTGRRDDTAGLGDWFVDDERLAGRPAPPRSTTCARSAWSSGCGSSPRWSTPTATSPARIRTGSCAAGWRCRRPRASSRCSTSRTRRPTPTSPRDCTRCSTSTRSPTSSGTTTATSSMPAAARRASPACASTRSPSTGCSTSSRRAHPGLEIESCASGGARVDLGILDRTDRIWTSDSLDPLERLDEPAVHRPRRPARADGHAPDQPGRALVGAHRRARAQRRRRAVRALRRSSGTSPPSTTQTRAAIAAWVALAKRLRPLVATGRTVDVDGTDPGIDVRGMVAADAASAVFTITQTETTVAYPAGRVRLPGLDPDRALPRCASSPTASTATTPGSPPLEWAHARHGPHRPRARRRRPPPTRPVPPAVHRRRADRRALTHPQHHAQGGAR